ncbi:hypothetical protein CDL12_09899 [Handroanthus impetiginosus]|uniref:Protein JASON n=1 Tax=Handroanthus impetiginosus TaxID=429701 RepID=A0A2G9HJG6_9LAMI|nr:hypothetical protein CDL12_09899 [Handroanthus impetiginosus]
MSCFFGCFRVKESKSSIITPPEPVVPRSKNALSSLFLCDDESLRKGAEGRNPMPQEFDVRELKEEAKFLKARGNLSETPIKIRKASGKWEGSKLEKHSDEWVTGSGSLLDTPSSCITDGRNTRRASSSSIQRRDISNVMNPMHDSETHSETSSVSTQVFAPSVQFKSNSVCFDCESDRSAFSSKDSSSECASHHPKQSGSIGIRSVTKPSHSEMSAAYMNDIAIGKVEIPSESKEMEDESSDSNYPRGSNELYDEATLMSTPKSKLARKRPSVDEEMNETSLSSFLKPPSTEQDGNNKRFSSVPSENVYRVRTPEDRPILGMMAAHWNEDEKSHVSPKWWDGNGIPNSTNKYKEDQKVSWHATPFEERLEKALSEETLISQRKPISSSTPIEFNDNEESDTAISHLQSSAHLKPVVSF